MPGEIKQKKSLDAEVIQEFLKKEILEPEVLAAMLGVEQITVKHWLDKKQPSPTGTEEMVLSKLILSHDVTGLDSTNNHTHERLLVLMTSIGGGANAVSIGMATVSGIALLGGPLARATSLLSAGGIHGILRSQKKNKEALQGSFTLYLKLKTIYETIELKLKQLNTGRL